MARLQRLVLEAALTGRRFRDHGGPTRLPDLDLMLAWSNGPLLVESSGLADRAVAEGLRPSLRIVSVEDLAAAARSTDRLPYLRLDTEMLASGDVRIILHAKLWSGDNRSVGLGGLSVVFRRTTTGWEVDGSPTIFAT